VTSRYCTLEQRISEAVNRRASVMNPSVEVYTAASIEEKLRKIQDEYRQVERRMLRLLQPKGGNEGMLGGLMRADLSKVPTADKVTHGVSTKGG
jgi:hypothetical protein